MPLVLITSELNMRDVSTSKVSLDTAVEDAGFFEDDDALLFLLENIIL